MTDNARIVREALNYIAGRLQLDVDDGGRPDQWSMEDMIRMAQKAVPALAALESELATTKADLAAMRDTASDQSRVHVEMHNQITDLNAKLVQQIEAYARLATKHIETNGRLVADLARAREEERERIMVLFRIVEHAVHEDSWCQECALENVIPAIANFRAALAPKQKGE